MTEDRHDARIRDLVAELAASAPPPPAFSRIAERLPNHTRGAHMSAITGDVMDDAEDSADFVPPYINDRSHRAKPWRLMAALVAFSLATAGGVFAYGALNDNDGAATPEKAVEHFVDAFADSDVTGMLEALAPSERVVLRESLESLNSQASRLDLTKGLDLGDVSGANIEVSGLKLTSTGLSEDVASVDVEGTLRSKAVDGELPIGDVARKLLVDALPEGGYQGVADALDKVINRDGIQLVTVREGDGWHVSVWYTVAEYMRKDQDLPAPAFGHSPITPLGSDSPEAAVRSLLEAGGNYAKAVALVAPDEGRVLYDYVPVFSHATPGYERTDYTIHQLGTHVDGDGDRRTVHIDTYDIEWTDKYTFTTSDTTGPQSQGSQVSNVRESFDGDCVITTATSPASTTDPTPPQTDKVCRKDSLAKGTTALEWKLATTTQVTVERQNGRWFLSPVRSFADEAVANLALVPDGKTFSNLIGDKERLSFFNLLPYDVFWLALGSPPNPAMYLGVTTSSSSSSSGQGESGPLPTIPFPTTTVVVGPASTSPAESTPVTTGG